MARIVSLVMLVVILLVIGGLFLQVMAGFLLPLFLALLLVVVFRPLHQWFYKRLGHRDRMAALATTVTILLLVLIPLAILLIEAGYEAQHFYQTAVNQAAPTAEPGKEKSPLADAGELADWVTDRLVQLGNRIGLSLNRDDVRSAMTGGLQKFLAPTVLRTTQLATGLLVNLAIMILAAYYFFADGPQMLRSVMGLLPLDNSRMWELVDRFDSVTRAVVAATLLSALVQGLLTGLGFYMADVGSVFLLTALSILFSLVPFVGAAILWVPVCLWLYAIEGRTMAAVLMAIYCLGLLSSIDNIIKPLVLRGRSNLHPLLALLSVLGGVQALGPIGILVGPMVVAFLQTLLKMVHSELTILSGPDPAPSPLIGRTL